jgi:hypothetical protein
MTKTILAALSAAVLAVALGACGSSDPTSTSASAGATGTQGSGSTTAQQQGRGQLQSPAVQQCLKDQGVTPPAFGRGGNGNGQPPQGGYGGARQGGLPGGGGPPGGGMSQADRDKLQAALKQCGVTLPNRGANGQGAGSRPDVNDAAYRKRVQDYVACVRKNGFDLPNPDFSGKGPIFDPSKVDQSDPTFQSASQKCQSVLRPQGQGAAGSQPGATSSTAATT